MPEIRKWTLMFYFASDNPLAISVVSQLKALKAAGFHRDVNVVTQFDPYTRGTPTHIFDVNLVNKLRADPDEDNIGFCEPVPVVRNLIEDKLWRDERTGADEQEIAQGLHPDGELVRTALRRVLAGQKIAYNPPVAPFSTNGFQADEEHGFQEPDPETSLTDFLRFCAENYPAEHYMLFLLGHGVVVGNDIFLLDENAANTNSLTLAELGRILTDFNNFIELDNGKFELISFHSCSVSSMEVAFELQGTANYMLASQSPAFVGSWPYRDILVRIFHDVSQKADHDVRKLMSGIYEYCLRNSADYLLAGYSFQITLCDLTKLATLKRPLANLSRALEAGLDDQTTRDCILLSHWKAQSFFNEMYTDLYDFCFCFSHKVDEMQKDPQSRGRLTPELLAIHNACQQMMDKLVKENPKKAGHPELEQFIVSADSLGPAYQYSRGISVYFPWSAPTVDRRILAQYERYRFTTDFERAIPRTTPWLAFLRKYFEKTMRETSSDEPDHRRFLPLLSATHRLDEDLASLVYGGEGTLDGSLSLLPLRLKGDPTDKTGGEVEAVSIKNYPRDVRSRRSRRRQASARFPLIEAFNVFVSPPNGVNEKNGNHNGKCNGNGNGNP